MTDWIQRITKRKQEVKYYDEIIVFWCFGVKGTPDKDGCDR
mgnify:CR=1 FL=1